ncbi:MAG TPA: DNA (cytosine-5-)-methyltransferase [Candidatus Baltobacteraceae bacterium]|nr:DNA (cytosine-5-)-methyltransferase [Candidatus Baltobacteraceae bacterium]
MSFAVLELCAGGGGQALGLEMAGFHHAAAVECEAQFCTTLRKNRPHWNVIQQDIRHLRHQDFTGIDLLAAGVPCPPFSIASKQLGADDDRDMFPAVLDLIEHVKPRAVLLENVPGFASVKFEQYRRNLLIRLSKLGYQPDWQILQASDYGVPQLRPRFVLVGVAPKDAEFFAWPIQTGPDETVGSALVDLMGANGWLAAEAWAQRALGIAPTIVGGSKKHGGPDLGPTRARLQWRQLGVDGLGIADAAPEKTFPEDKLPRLTVRMVARIQSFPDEWQFSGGKTWAYRQVGNAFPPQVAKCVGQSIMNAFNRRRPPTNGSGVEMRLFDADGSLRQLPFQFKPKDC